MKTRLCCRRMSSLEYDVTFIRLLCSVYLSRVQQILPLSSHYYVNRLLRKRWRTRGGLTFAMILCGTNFCILYDMKLTFTSQLQIASQSPCNYFQNRMTQNSNVINICFYSSAQRLMEETTQKFDLLWSTTFTVIVYLNY